MVFRKVMIYSLVFVAVYSSVESLAEHSTDNNEVKPLNGTGNIWCFQCNSIYNKDCADIKPFDTSSLYYKQCPQFEDEQRDGPNRTYFCRKITQIVNDEDKGTEEKRVIRKCGWMEQDKECYKITNPIHKEIVCACHKNGCNAAPELINLRSYLPLLSTALIATILTLYKYH